MLWFLTNLPGGAWPRCKPWGRVSPTCTCQLPEPGIQMIRCYVPHMSLMILSLHHLEMLWYRNNQTILFKYHVYQERKTVSLRGDPDYLTVLGQSHQQRGRRCLRAKGCQWPPCSPDLNPFDLCLWGYLLSEIHCPRHARLNKLQAKGGKQNWNVSENGDTLVFQAGGLCPWTQSR